MTSMTFKLEEELLAIIKASAKKRALGSSAYLRTLVLADQAKEVQK